MVSFVFPEGKGMSFFRLFDYPFVRHSVLFLHLSGKKEKQDTFMSNRATGRIRRLCYFVPETN